MEERGSAPMLRIPASLMPSYNSVMATEDGKQAQKRVRVLCGVCDKIRYYSIHRGVTRIGGVIACEACRHFYQKFKRQPCILTCTEGGGCLDLNDNSRTRCRACWIGHILSRCPVPPEMYDNLISHLPPPIREKMPPEAQVAGLIPENRKGSLGLEVSRNGEWEDVTITETVEPEPNEDSNAEAPTANDSGGVDNFCLQKFIKLEEGLDSDDEDPIIHIGLANERRERRESSEKPQAQERESRKRKRSDDSRMTPGMLLDYTVKSSISQSSVTEDDNLSLFCLYITSQLSGIKDPELLEDIKFDIQCVVHEGLQKYYAKK